MGIPFVLAAIMLAAPAHDHAAALDTAKIERLTGAKGRMNATEGVFKVSVPRSDLTVTVGSVKLTPPSGLTSWAAFTPADAGVMVMGDIVLTQDQVDPVMGVALDNGLEVTALHNHFLGESPRIMFMHIGGTGPVDSLAAAVGKVFASLRSPGAPIPGALGRTGVLADGVYKVTIGRSTQMHGHTVGNAMGVNTWAAFSGSDAQAVVDGDFAMLETELQPVLQALHRGGIHVVAIHQHMAGESPRIVFLHYWGVGPAETLARGLRAALDQTKP
jgi:hypothetical protein